MSNRFLTGRTLGGGDNNDDRWCAGEPGGDAWAGSPQLVEQCFGNSNRFKL